jgi:hypothetical protein
MSILSQIYAIKSDIQKKAKNASYYERKCYLENEVTLDALEYCFETYAEGSEDLKDALKQVLADRWERIRHHSAASYTVQPFNQTNQLCLQIANMLSPLPEGEDNIDALPERTGPYFLLMPTLAVSKDIYGTDIHNYRLNQLTLSDDETLFIPIQESLDAAFAAGEGDGIPRHQVSENTVYPNLTTTERKRIEEHSVAAKQYVASLDEFRIGKRHGGGLRNQLWRLKAALEAGGARRGGEELDSGHAANEGIAEFAVYWNDLSREQQASYYRENRGLQDAIGRLLRPNAANYREVRFCVEILANNLERILSRMPEDTSKLEGCQRELAALFSTKAETYPRDALNAQPPRILSFFLDAEANKALDDYVRIERLFMANHRIPEAMIYNLSETSSQFLPEENSRTGQTQLKEGLSLGDEELDKLLLLRTVRLDLSEQKVLYKEGHHALTFIASYKPFLIPESLKALHEQYPDGIPSEILDHQNSDDQTALMHAVSKHNIGAVEALLAAGADIGAVSRAGKTALSLAVELGDQALIKAILLKAMTLNAEAQSGLLTQMSGLLESCRHILQYTMLEQPELFDGVIQESEKNPDLISVCEQAKKANVYLRQNILETHFNAHLAAVERQVETLREPKALEVANTLLMRLNQAKANYVQNIWDDKADSAQILQTESIEALKSARPVLNHCESWPKIIKDFINALLAIPTVLRLSASGFYQVKANFKDELDNIDPDLDELPEP